MNPVVPSCRGSIHRTRGSDKSDPLGLRMKDNCQTMANMPLFLFLSFCVFLCTVIFSADAGARNLISNPGFEKKTKTAENLWDGVDNSGRLKVTGASAPFVIDINGDNKKDIICGDSDWVGGHPSSGMIWYYLNSGTEKAPVFTTCKFVKRRFDANVKPFVVDWNGDGRKDIILGSVNGWVYFLPGKSTKMRFKGLKFFEVDKKRLDIGQFSAPAVVDWNGDRRKDLILGEGTYSANSIYIYLNDGTSSYPKFEKKGKHYLAYGEGKMHLTPSIVDWDRDGDPDLIVGDDKGYINLYINEGKKRGGTVKTLKYAGRLKNKSGREIDVGSMATPCAVDWDGDGDVDIVCGNSSGHIYIILNEGSQKKPKFANPLVLKGKNVLKGQSIPEWGIDNYTYDIWRLKGAKRRGAYSIAVDKRKSHSGMYCLKVTCYEEYGGSAVVHGVIKSPLKRGGKYKLTFYVRGKDVEGVWKVWSRYSREKMVVKNIRTYKTVEPTWTVSEKFKPGLSWKKVKGTFEVPAVKDAIKLLNLKDKKKKKKLIEKLGEDRKCFFEISVSGDGTMWIDDVVLEKD